MIGGCRQGTHRCPGRSEPQMAFVLTAITDDPDLAARCDAAGVDRIGVDIERLNKAAQQGHLPDARISQHRLSDLRRLAGAVTRAALFARLNPLHEGSATEIAEALEAGARVLMLPYFTTAREVRDFVRLVAGRARVVLLLETAAALVRLPEILAVEGIDEVMVGLNDLHLSMGLANPFELTTAELLDLVSAQIRARGHRFGFGGLARADDHALPVPADLVIAQHVRLGSETAWLARSFFTGLAPDALASEIARLRERLAYWAAQPAPALAEARDRLHRHLTGGFGR